MSVSMHIDLLGPVDGPPSLRVRARLQMLRTDEGGRRIGISSGLRPNHNFGDAMAREFYIGQITVSDDARVDPGETGDVIVEFLNGPGLSALLTVGRTWRIQEGPHLVARAEVLELLDET